MLFWNKNAREHKISLRSPKSLLLIFTVICYFNLFSFFLPNNTDNFAFSQELTEKEKLMLEVKRNPFEPVLEEKEKKKKEKKEGVDGREKRDGRQEIKDIEIKGIISEVRDEGHAESEKKGRVKGVVIVEKGQKSLIISVGSKIDGISLRKIEDFDVELEVEGKILKLNFNGIAEEFDGKGEKDVLLNIYSHGAKLSDLLIGISYITGKNIITPSEIEKRIFISARRISPDDFFEIISSFGIFMEKRGNSIVFFTKGERKEEVVKTFLPKFVSPDDIVDVLRKMGLNAISVGKLVIVRGEEKLIEHAEEIVKDIDRKPRQIKIEAKIFELTEDGAKEIRSFLSAARNGVNLLLNVGEPQIGGVMESGSIKGGVISIDSNIVDYIFSYLVRKGKAKILSSPNILTIEGKKAKIVQGISIPYEASTQFAVETRFVDALLELEVIPYISGDKTFMKLKVSRNFPTFEVRSFRGVPAISKNEINSEIVVDEKKSVLVGGIIIESSSEVKEGVPILSSIPVIGFLFSYNASKTERREVIISIKPEFVIDEE